MGCDLMCELGIVLTSTAEGVKLISQPDKVFTAVQVESSALMSGNFTPLLLTTARGESKNFSFTPF